MYFSRTLEDDARDLGSPVNCQARWLCPSVRKSFSNKVKCKMIIRDSIKVVLRTLNGVKVLLSGIILLFSVLRLESQEVVVLYPGMSPNSLPEENQEYSSYNEVVDSLTFKVSKPTIQIFHARSDRRNRPAVIICPGGGYGVLLTKREGTDVARKLAEGGVTGIVLKYRLPDKDHLLNPGIGPLQDLQMAIHTVRQNAEKWGINPQNIGVMGFSAGGHLAASSGVHHRTFWVDTTHGENVRPDFMVLVNPVISFSDEYAQLGSRKNLLGAYATRESIDFFSTELHVDASTPPTFLVHNNTDSVVLVENSLMFFNELRKYKIPAEMHIYEKGEHGFLTWPSFEEWFGRVLHWMRGRDLVD